MQINGFSNPLGYAGAYSSGRTLETAALNDRVVTDSASVSLQGDAGRRVAPGSAPEATTPESTDNRAARDRQEVEAEQRVVRELAARDREVRQHEMAHQMAGGQYTGAVTYTFERGPDGVMYAVGGEVRIDTSPVPGDPEATLQKAETVERAALAPSDPSPQDLRVAASARAMAAEARAELLREQQDALESDDPVQGVATSDELEADVLQQAEEMEQARRAEQAEREQQAAEDEAAEAQQLRQEALAEELQQRRERSAEALREFARDLAEIQAQLRELNKRLVETGALKGGSPVGSLLDRQV
ncbi:SrpA-related protein [Nitrincola lacisaponensis]|uniref:SrpA-related protein n=1 Tax=Nitrincola lacisaponensis TaxID=267850 RepID=A0A063Y1F0_9GAMM|nr:putative metalloprotease CJM1_0395 family protein [Nitrincola lacisaponensis]KDE39489.1 SrpA-related protein [Nitrincola lacisaponensis]